jgi:hypothetical protein
VKKTRDCLWPPPNQDGILLLVFSESTANPGPAGLLRPLMLLLVLQEADIKAGWQVQKMSRGGSCEGLARGLWDHDMAATPMRDRLRSKVVWQSPWPQ